MATFVSLSLEEWAELQESARILQALRTAGVDNWEGYEHAMQLLREEDEADE